MIFGFGYVHDAECISEVRERCWAEQAQEQLCVANGPRVHKKLAPHSARAHMDWCVRGGIVIKGAPA